MSTLQQSGKISLIEVANEFGVTSGPRSLLSFYRGGGNVSATDLITSSATSAPSNDTPVQNFAGVTGLTLTRISTTNSTDTGYVTRRSFSSNSLGGPVNFLISENQINSFTRVDWRLRRTGGFNDNSVRAKISRSQQVSSGGLTTMNTSGTSHAFTNITQIGSYRYNTGDNGTFVEEDRRYGTETVISYSFVNNSSFAVTVVGATTQTVQAGGTLTGVSPDGNSQYTCSYTPTTNNQTATVSPPTGASEVSDVGGITSLSTQPLVASSTPALISSQTNQTVTLTAGTYYNFTAQQVWVTPGSADSLAHGGYQMGSDRADSGVTVGVSVSATGLSNTNSNRDRGTFYNGVSQGTSFTGQPLLAVNDLARGGGRHAMSAVVRIYITVQGIPSADTVLTFYPNADSSPSRNFGRSTFSSQSITNDTTIAGYDFTNNTGNDVTISGSGVTTTTITNGNSTTSSLEIPNGNFTIQHQTANPVAVNGNIPSAGKISLTNFYGTFN